MLAAEDETDETYGWALNQLLEGIQNSNRSSVDDASSVAKLRANLLGLALACAVSGRAHLSILSSQMSAVLTTLITSATRTPLAIADHAEADSVRTTALQALTALVTNGKIKLANGDGAGLLLAASSVASSVPDLKAPSNSTPILLPSATAFNASYFLLMALLRQRPRLVHAAAPLLLAAVRGLLHALAHAAGGGSLPLECARNTRRLLEQIAGHKKVLVRHASYLLVEVVALCKEKPLPAAYNAELLPGIHALLGMCTEIEVQAVHAASDGGRQRILKELLESYERSFKYRGSA